ncbi:transcriptional regulator [Paenibacillus sp. CAA11]|uniref:Rrf2 family transcriptional regulator n=1 Tax=Paenibacillus sp. CAA11 TaxID=1532905 RepID=UPI000D3C86BD|nr:Rrf2 family transcriptional regulator [Paenibacillus sp. CAA11]AWB47077.1 transcriptional regulator [Paenibacillus sp. CAA11]
MESEHNLCGAPNFKWFGLALQALVILSSRPEPYPSGQLAQCLQSEATLLRRILSQLACRGIVETREGRDGGYQLLRDAGTLTLAEVYNALEAKDPCWTGMLESTGDHPFGQQMRLALEPVISELNERTLNLLQQYTIKDLMP